MSETPDSEDLLIRRLLLGAAIFVIGGALTVAIVIAFCVSMNFNLLNWME